jgi:hypothetical protein
LPFRVALSLTKRAKRCVVALSSCRPVASETQPNGALSCGVLLRFRPVAWLTYIQIANPSICVVRQCVNVLQLSFYKVLQSISTPHIDITAEHDGRFLKVTFLNKGIDFIDLSSICRDKRVTDSIPKYFKNSEIPIICHKY